MTQIEWRPLDGPVPLFDHHPSMAWASPGISLAGFGEAFRFEPAPGKDRFTSAWAKFSEWCSRADIRGDGVPIAFASFTFDPETAGSVLVVPEVLLGRRRDHWFMVTVDDVDSAPLFHPAGTADPPRDRPRYAGASISEVGWVAQVAEAIRRIGTGELEKVVLARDYEMWSKHPFDPRRLLERLHGRFPECFTFLVDGLVGSSPELLVRRSGDRVESVVLAGTAARSVDPEADLELAEALLRSDKDLREHAGAVRSVETVLQVVCARLVKDASPELLELANVRHLATKFRGVLRDSRPVMAVADALHPTAAVAGNPTEPAVALIRELEGMSRGRYAGPVGWTDQRGDGEFAIALRCAELSGARARLFAGAGLVDGSLPEAELEETRLKLLAMLSALD